MIQHKNQMNSGGLRGRTIHMKGPISLQVASFNKAELPKDVLYNIFSRIPIRCLARFRLVCRQWREYIHDPQLAAIHLQEPEPMHIAPIKSSNRLLQPVSVLSFLVIMKDTTAGIQVEKNLSSKLLVKRSSIYQKSIIQAYCNGLITLVQHHHLHDLSTSFVVINPLTKECHELPPMKRSSLGQGLGFDNSTNTFKMVCVFLKSHYLNGVGIGAQVHVLGTDSWQDIPAHLPFYNIGGEAIYANGRLYWFGVPSSRIGSQTAKLVWLDMKKEEFGMIDLPIQGKGWFSDKLVDLNGEVGFVCHKEGSDNKEVWILKHEEWMIQCVFDESESDYRGLVVLGCWNKDGDLLLSSSLGCQYFVYRLKSHSFHRLMGPKLDPGEEKAEVRMYQSSFLSIKKKANIICSKTHHI